MHPAKASSAGAWPGHFDARVTGCRGGSNRENRLPRRLACADGPHHSNANQGAICEGAVWSAICEVESRHLFVSGRRRLCVGPGATLDAGCTYHNGVALRATRCAARNNSIDPIHAAEPFDRPSPSAPCRGGEHAGKTVFSQTRIPESADSARACDRYWPGVIPHTFLK